MLAPLANLAEPSTDVEGLETRKRLLQVAIALPVTGVLCGALVGSPQALLIGVAFALGTTQLTGF